ncbi:signal transduction histidine kinase [Pedobacter cryoconitis]|uniref:sensor histidine kinase n=1 Tax=Pedobacter cryoconitis TaxID=188932 RepID=UPI001607ED99|nr:histidine kinase [Pedobacter cryoconitis]MBB6271138.1 signal transduction histidine kinase [Pedobacter cryoconitis]
MNLVNIDIRLFVVVSIAAMLLLFISFLLIFIFTQRKKLHYQNSIQSLNEHQKNQLIEAAIKSEETERHRIADELHDEVGAILASSKLHFHSIKLGAGEYNESIYNKARELLDEGIKKVRNISHSLHSAILQEFGLNEAISHFASKIAHESLVEVTTTMDPKYHCPMENDISIYRIIQELLHNILTHAKATKIHIISEYTSQKYLMKISHNGDGLTQQRFEELRFKRNGLGLKNIQNRVIFIKGELLFSQQGHDYHIDIQVPINQIKNE